MSEGYSSWVMVMFRYTFILQQSISMESVISYLLMAPLGSTSRTSLTKGCRVFMLQQSARQLKVLSWGALISIEQEQSWSIMDYDKLWVVEKQNQRILWFARTYSRARACMAMMRYSSHLAFLKVRSMESFPFQSIYTLRSYFLPLFPLPSLSWRAGLSYFFFLACSWANFSYIAAISSSFSLILICRSQRALMESYNYWFCSVMMPSILRMVCLHSRIIVFSLSGSSAILWTWSRVRFSNSALRLMPSLPPFLFCREVVVMEELRGMMSQLERWDSLQEFWRDYMRRSPLEAWLFQRKLGQLCQRRWLYGRSMETLIGASDSLSLSLSLSLLIFCSLSSVSCSFQIILINSLFCWPISSHLLSASFFSLAISAIFFFSFPTSPSNILYLSNKEASCFLQCYISQDSPQLSLMNILMLAISCCEIRECSFWRQFSVMRLTKGEGSREVLCWGRIWLPYMLKLVVLTELFIRLVWDRPFVGSVLLFSMAVMSETSSLLMLLAFLPNFHREISMSPRISSVMDRYCFILQISQSNCSPQLCLLPLPFRRPSRRAFLDLLEPSLRLLLREGCEWLFSETVISDRSSSFTFSRQKGYLPEGRHWLRVKECTGAVRRGSMCMDWASAGRCAVR